MRARTAGRRRARSQAGTACSWGLHPPDPAGKARQKTHKAGCVWRRSHPPGHQPGHAHQAEVHVRAAPFAQGTRPAVCVVPARKPGHALGVGGEHHALGSDANRAAQLDAQHLQAAAPTHRVANVGDGAHGLAAIAQAGGDGELGPGGWSRAGGQEVPCGVFADGEQLAHAVLACGDEEVEHLPDSGKAVEAHGYAGVGHIPKGFSRAGEHVGARGVSEGRHEVAHEG